MYYIGIDEVGRGPLAGPVAVGVVKLKHRVFEFGEKGIKDSKKLSAKNRELWYKKIKEAKKRGELDFFVSFVSSKIIDEKGLTYAIQKAVNNSLKKLSAHPKKSQILLDGGLKAPKEFIFQKTIIKGDEKEPVIALASIVAKVTRDKLMKKYTKKYPQYRFDIHKGYGTKAHYKEIFQNPLTPIHRRRFI
ncbi:MAG: ribonuclease HII [Patescibacteria group bacterium]|nr:ribonuclease HII [Patescibacteria group bacterium]